jgi:hypothetical protein
MAKAAPKKEQPPALPPQFEGVGQDFDVDIGLPILHIIQSTSPQIKKSDPDYETKKIPGAEEGDVFLAGTQEVIPRPLEVIPLGVVTLFAEWKPRNSSGGFVQYHNESILGETTKGGKNGYDDILPNQNEIIKTTYVAVQAYINEIWQPALFAFTKTQLKPGNQWLNQVKSFRYPTGARGAIFSCVWNANTVSKTNEEGSWSVWHFEKNRTLDYGDPGEKVLMDDCYASLTGGSVKAMLPDLNTKAVTPVDDNPSTVDVDVEGEPF